MGGKSRSILRHISLIVLCFILLSPLPSSGSSSSPQELLHMGIGAFNDGFYQVAEAQFREFLQAHPLHSHVPEVKYLLGKALYEQQKFTEAKEVFVALLTPSAVFQAKDAAYFWLGRSCEQLADLSSAHTSFLTVVKKYPHSLWYQSSLYLLGKISFQEGRHKRAEMYFRKVLQVRRISLSLSYNAKFWLGLSLYEQRRYKEAENFLQEVVESKSNKGLLEEALYWLGEMHIKLEKYKKGAAVFRSLLDQFPQSSYTAHALYGESLCLYMCERQEEALKGLLILKKDFLHTSLLPHILSLTGEIYIDLNRHQEAIEIFKEFLSRFPQDPMRTKTLLNLAWCYLKRGDLARVKEVTYEIVEASQGGREKALAQYIMAELNTCEGNCQEAMPYWFNLLNTTMYRQEALFKIANCSYQERKFKECLVNTDLLQLEYPNFYKMDEVLWIQGESYKELGNVSEAGEAYQKLIREHKRSSWYPWSIYRMIAFSFNEENIREAERYFDILYKKFAYHELSHEAALQLGIRKAEGSHYESSLHYLTIAARSLDSNIAKNALCWQGEIYFNLKEYQKAWDAYQKVIAEYSSSKDALAAIAYLEMGNIKHLLKDQKKAKEAYKRAIELSEDDHFKEKVKSLLKDLKETNRGGGGT
jgi:TolA-binding protein